MLLRKADAVLPELFCVVLIIVCLYLFVLIYALMTVSLLLIAFLFPM